MERTDKFLIFITLSILIHLLLIFFIRILDERFSRPQPIAQKPTLKVLLNDNPSKQVVKVKQPKTKKPEKSNYFSEQNTSAEKEMKAKYSGKFRNSPGTELDSQAGSKQKKSTAEIGERKGFPRIIDLLNPLQGGMRSQTYDDLDKPLGDQTLLNTHEYIYASFFNRVKELVGPIWEGRVRNLVYEIGPSLRVLNYYSILHVTLNREGEVLDVDVIHSAVNREFDMAAQDSFWEAKRFPNPPSGLYKGKQVASFDFSFHVDLQKSGFIRLQTIPDERYLLPPGDSRRPFMPPVPQ